MIKKGCRFIVKRTPEVKPLLYKKYGRVVKHAVGNFYHVSIDGEKNDFLLNKLDMRME